MNIKPILWAVGMTALPLPALAQGFTGGELTLDATAFGEGDNPSAVSYSGALEYAINRSFSVAGDLSVYDFSLLGDEITNVTLHGIYHLGQQSSVGVFVGQDSFDDDDATFLGLEGGYEAGPLAVEGYVALYDNDDDTTVLSIDGTYDLNGQFAAIGRLGYADFDDQSFVRISAGAEYDFANGPTVYAELGNVSGDNDSSAFISLGASVEFGAARGTTFDRRSIFEAIQPGF